MTQNQDIEDRLESLLEQPRLAAIDVAQAFSQERRKNLWVLAKNADRAGSYWLIKELRKLHEKPGGARIWILIESSQKSIGARGEVLNVSLDEVLGPVGKMRCLKPGKAPPPWVTGLFGGPLPTAGSGPSGPVGIGVQPDFEAECSQKVAEHLDTIDGGCVAMAVCRSSSRWGEEAVLLPIGQGLELPHEAWRASIEAMSRKTVAYSRWFAATCIDHRTIDGAIRNLDGVGTTLRPGAHTLLNVCTGMTQLHRGRRMRIRKTEDLVVGFAQWATARLGPQFEAVAQPDLAPSPPLDLVPDQPRTATNLFAWRALGLQALRVALLDCSGTSVAAVCSAEHYRNTPFSALRDLASPPTSLPLRLALDYQNDECMARLAHLLHLCMEQRTCWPLRTLLVLLLAPRVRVVPPQHVGEVPIGRYLHPTPRPWPDVPAEVAFAIDCGDQSPGIWPGPDPQRAWRGATKLQRQAKSVVEARYHHRRKALALKKAEVENTMAGDLLAARLRPPTDFLGVLQRVADAHPDSAHTQRTAVLNLLYGTRLATPQREATGEKKQKERLKLPMQPRPARDTGEDCFTVLLAMVLALHQQGQRGPLSCTDDIKAGLHSAFVKEQANEQQKADLARAWVLAHQPAPGPRLALPYGDQAVGHVPVPTRYLLPPPPLREGCSSQDYIRAVGIVLGVARDRMAHADEAERNYGEGVLSLYSPRRRKSRPIKRRKGKEAKPKARKVNCDY